MSSPFLVGSQKTKATRTSAPKSRNGCVVCKARRMKCDEKRPQCKTCIKSGHQCQYKDPKAESKFKKPRIILPQNEFAVNISTPTQTRPSQTLSFIDQREIYYFWAYQEEAAQELTGVLKSSPWIRTMLQACHTESFVLRSVVAIGALNKSLKIAHKASLCPPLLQKTYQDVSNKHREFALMSYDKAIIGMRQILLDHEGPATLRKALMACLLVHCIEVYMRSPATGYAQSHAGYKLMQQWLANNSHHDVGIASPNGSVIEDELFHELSRLDTQHARWVRANDLERHATRRHEASETVGGMPLQFGDLDEARAYQELIVRRTAHLLGETYARITVAKIEMRHAPTADTPGEIIDPCYIPTLLLTERDAYIADIRRWCQAFRPMLGPLLLSSDPKTVIGASMLMIEALNAEIDLAGAFFTEECSYDVLLPHYKEIVYLSQIVSQRDDEILPKDVPTFSLSAGNAWCLYDTASTCRDPVLRQEALSMLRSEAEQDTTKYKARLVVDASYVIALEEQGRKEDGCLPESSRYRRQWVLNQFEDSSGTLTYIFARKLGYPIGKSYPAKREWRTKTFISAEVADMTVGETFDSPWPSAAARPNFVKWQEVHEELLERTARMRLALGQHKPRVSHRTYRPARMCSRSIPIATNPGQPSSQPRQGGEPKVAQPAKR